MTHPHTPAGETSINIKLTYKERLEVGMEYRPVILALEGETRGGGLVGALCGAQGWFRLLKKTLTQKQDYK